MKLDTRRKICTALSFGSGVSLGACASVITGAACKCIFKDNPLAAFGVFAVANIGAIQLLALAVDPIVENIYNWVYKEENQKRELEATEALLSSYKSN